MRQGRPGSEAATVNADRILGAPLCRRCIGTPFNVADGPLLHSVAEIRSRQNRGVASMKNSLQLGESIFRRTK